MIDRKAGTRRLYQVDPAGLAILRTYLDQMWERSLASFERRCARTSLARSGARSSCPPAVRRAFAVFTSGMTGWWPKHPPHRRGADRRDHHRALQGRALVHPPQGRRRDLHRLRPRLGAAVAAGLDVADQRGLALRPVARDDRRGHLQPVEGGTRVALEHRDLERFGPEAERMHQVFSGPTPGAACSRRMPGRSERRADRGGRVKRASAAIALRAWARLTRLAAVRYVAMRPGCAGVPATGGPPLIGAADETAAGPSERSRIWAETELATNDRAGERQRATRALAVPHGPPAEGTPSGATLTSP